MMATSNEATRQVLRERVLYSLRPWTLTRPRSLGRVYSHVRLSRSSEWEMNQLMYSSKLRNSYINKSRLAAIRREAWHGCALTSPQNSSTTFLADETTPITLLSKSKTPPPRYMTKSGASNSVWRRLNPNARSRLEDTNAKAWDSCIVPLDSKAA